MYYYSARYYDPATGRFTAPDPISFVESPYAYCGNNPASMVDPTGMASVPYHDPNLEGEGGNNTALMSFDEKVAASFNGGVGWGCTNWQYDKVTGKFIRYWFVYFTSSLTDASGELLSNYSYQARRAERYLRKDIYNYFINTLYIQDLHNWWNSQMSEGKISRHLPLPFGKDINGVKGFVFEAYGHRNGKYLSGSLILYYDGHKIGEWEFVSGSKKSYYAIDQGEWTYTGITIETNEAGMVVDGFGWKAYLADQFGRIGIRIHPDGGTEGITKGCIGIKGQGRDLFNFLANYSYSIPVFVP